MTKNSVVTGMVNVDKLYACLGDKIAAKRFFVLALMKIDGAPQKTSLEFKISDLVNDRIYTNNQAAAHGLDLCIPSLTKIRVGRGETLFQQFKTLPNGRKLYLTPGVKIAPAVRGFRVFPLAFLEASSSKPREKMRDLAFAIFTEAQCNVDRLATVGKFDIPFRTLQTKMRLPNVGANSNFIGQRSLAEPLENAVDKLMDLSGITGLAVLPNYYEGSIGEYLDKSFLTVTFSGDLLKNFLDAFGKTAVRKPLPEKVATPAPGTNIPFWLEGDGTLPMANTENISAQFAWLAMNCDDVCHQLEKGADLKYALEDLRTVLLNLERHIDLRFARKNIIMANNAASDAAREYYATYALGEIAFWFSPQWLIIRETVNRLSEAGQLGNLTDSLAVKLLMAKTADEKWDVVSGLPEVAEKEAVNADFEVSSC